MKCFYMHEITKLESQHVRGTQLTKPLSFILNSDPLRILSGILDTFPGFSCISRTFELTCYEQ